MLEMCYEYDTLGGNVFLEYPFCLVYGVDNFTFVVSTSPGLKRSQFIPACGLLTLICSGAAPRSPQLLASKTPSTVLLHQRKTIPLKKRKEEPSIKSPRDINQPLNQPTSCSFRQPQSSTREAPLHPQTPLNVTTRPPTRLASRGTSLSLKPPHTRITTPTPKEKKAKPPNITHHL